MRRETDVAVVGSGFAGSILARALARRGHEVVVLEKGSHPRFALGESSTPLAGTSLERLAGRFHLPDLHALAAYGRWMEAFPDLRRGLKRGFTFFHHREGEEYRASPENRLLVAASPADAVADAHWLRSDVDHHLVGRARSEGVEVLEGCRVEVVARDADRFVLGAVRSTVGRDGDRRLEVRARSVVDASGPASVIARALGARRATVDLPARGLVCAHLEGLPDIAELLDDPLPPGPYPDERSAVHHLFSDGWFYRLPFDHGVSSCGLLLTREAWSSGPDPASDPDAALETQLGRRAPLVTRQLEGSRQVVLWQWVPEVAHRLDRAAGKGWIALPHSVAFFDPLFSTGLAWSVRAIERAMDIVEGERSPAEYEGLLAREADRIEDLVRLAWMALDHPEAFQAVTQLYFAAVSFQESRERLLDPPPHGWAWEGFLGVGDPVVDGWFEEAEERLAAAPRPFAEWVSRAIEPRNVAGLADPAKEGLYGVDFEDVVRGAEKLGLGEAEARQRVGRLRSRLGIATTEERART